MGQDAVRRWTWADLQQFPDDDGLRREIIDGALFVNASPIARHQAVVIRISVALFQCIDPRGGQVYSAPLDVVFSDDNVVEPDVLLFLAEHLDRIRDGYPRAAPDLVVEVSSPSTKGLDRLKKRALYERFDVPEYWIVDLDHDTIEAYRLVHGAYGAPACFGRGDAVTTPLLPGWSAEFDWLVPAEG